LSSYIALSNWIWKIYHIDIILWPKLCQFVQFEISPSMSHKVFIFLKITLLFIMICVQITILIWCSIWSSFVRIYPNMALTDLIGDHFFYKTTLIGWNDRLYGLLIDTTKHFAILFQKGARVQNSEILHFWNTYLKREIVKQDKCPKYGWSSILQCRVF
jgi:hypothetical protein